MQALDAAYVPEADALGVGVARRRDRAKVAPPKDEPPMRITMLVSSIGLGLAAMACGHGSVKGPEVATTTSTQITSNESAVARITNARCDREVACNSVGPGKGAYETREACTNELFSASSRQAR